MWYEALFGDFALKRLANDDSAFGVAHAWCCSHIIDFQVNHEFLRIIKILKDK
jgi:hypothetical protein